MRKRPIRRDKPALADADELLRKFYAQARAQFGNAVKSYWFYDGALCPGCNQREIGAIKIRGDRALSLNAFIYRETGVLIGYFLCGTCAKYIFDESQKNPYTQTPLHAQIEQNLMIAYHYYLGSLNA
jgi:hypothetical protein